MSDTRRTTAPRRDAQRNRELILTEARHAFIDSGLDASMDAIAKAAGVGPGTLYRHFPTKDDLIAAVVNADEPRLEEQRDLIEAADLGPLEALETWLDVLARKMTAYDGLPVPLRAAVDATGTPLGSTCQVLLEATEAFLTPVRGAGLAKQSVTGRSLFLAVLGVAWASASTNDDGATHDQLVGILHSGWSKDPGAE